LYLVGVISLEQHNPANPRVRAPGSIRRRQFDTFDIDHQGTQAGTSHLLRGKPGQKHNEWQRVIRHD